jgi:predicted GIY-YIG superfamily endonuclease
MKEYVYYLICPIDKKVKYVGKTKKPKTRYNQHIKKLDKQLTPKRRWLEFLFSKNLVPKLVIVEEIEGDARILEQKHVDLNKETILNIHNPEKGMKSNKW